MPYLKIHHDIISPEDAATLCDLCPFSAISILDGKLDIDAGCTMCRLCANNGPEGAVTFEEHEDAPASAPAYASAPAPTSAAAHVPAAPPTFAYQSAGYAARVDDTDAWRGVAVFAECRGGAVHPVTMELVGKAKELAGVTSQPVYALLIGSGTDAAADRLLRGGADMVYVYDDPAFDEFLIEPYTFAFADFIEKAKPSAVLVGATNIGRSLAPRVAARFRTGVTADCTMLEMRENSNLIQIRPAFGGNIMARIVTPSHRPQFCTVRYKIFSAPKPADNPRGSLRRMELPADKLKSVIKLLHIEEKPAQIDISDAKYIVAVGRGFKRKDDLVMVEELAAMLGAQLACTRPLIENGWFDPRRQIGLSGRTVGAELIITIGVSGSVQFAAGMRGCKCIISINQDPNAAIFNIAHYAAVGDMYELLPALTELCRNARRT